MGDKDDNEQADETNQARTIDGPMLVEQALEKFCCYLYVGKGHPYYKAKPWNDDDRYPMDQRLRCVEVLASNKPTELVPIDKIKLAMDTKLVPRPDTLMCALALCARQKKSEKLRAAAYYFLAEHCKEWKYFILFIKHASLLCKTEGRKGWGRGWKNAVNKWYLTKDARSLCELVTTNKGNHGWTHRDILKLSHPDTSGLEVEKQAILCYVIRGLEQAKSEYNSYPEANKILQYIAAIEFYKRCETCSTVAGLIDSGEFTIDKAHQSTLKSEEVWCAALNHLDVRTILNSLPKLYDLNLVKERSLATELIVRSLTDKQNLLWNRVLPGDVVSVLNGHRALRSLVTQQESTVTKMTELVDAIESALDVARTVDITGSSERTYLVSVRLPERRTHDLSVQAGLSIALPLFHREGISESAVKIIYYDPRTGYVGSSGITKDMSFFEARELAHEWQVQISSPKDPPSHPMMWGCKGKKKYDVYIDVTNEAPTQHDLEEIARHRQSSNFNEARLINVIVNRIPVELKDNVWPEALTINGFDPHVPWIIEAYVRNLF